MNSNIKKANNINITTKYLLLGKISKKFNEIKTLFNFTDRF